MITETMRSSVRRISAFCEGGSGFSDRVTVFRKRRQIAKANRIGKMVKVYRNESRQTTKPNANICNAYH